MLIEVVRAIDSLELPVAAVFDVVLLDMLVDDIDTVPGVEDVLAAALLPGLSLKCIVFSHGTTLLLSVVPLPRTPTSLSGPVLITILSVFPHVFAGLEDIAISWPPSLPGVCMMLLVRGTMCNMVREIVEEGA